MKIILASCLFLVMAGVASAQGASVFVKGDNPYCWRDVSDVVHRLYHDVDDQLADQQTLRAGHVSTAAGDLFFQIQVTTQKNKKGEEGCRIYVDVGGGASLAHAAQQTEILNGRSTEQVANTIASQVEAMKKARDKKAKNAS
jgi:hypothetical protein